MLYIANIMWGFLCVIEALIFVHEYLYQLLGAACSETVPDKNTSNCTHFQLRCKLYLLPCMYLNFSFKNCKIIFKCILKEIYTYYAFHFSVLFSHFGDINV